ncbi:MAG TPA: PKD domain-containing protein [Gemmatimonadaceae bacterium]|nr:PKD domain-containing protein [Gemmatimonadaceae bacterium]
MRKHHLLVALTGILAACVDGSTPAPTATRRAPEPPPAASFARTGDGDPIVGEYIIRFKDSESDVDGRVRSLGTRIDGSVERTYRSAIKGIFVRKMSAAAAAALRNDPNVLSVEQNMTISLNTTQTGATWGIDRIDQRSLPLSTTYTYSGDGTGVTVYIIDTGINYTHNEYNGRTSFGVDEIVPSTNGADCNGHGSHVSGTIGGTTYGVAKNVKLVAVRVLNCAGSGSTAGVIAGIDWVTANRVRPAAANMSLGGGFSSTLNAAVTNSIAAGVVYGVAAGNSAGNACSESPSSTPNAITVGATDIQDRFANFSNFGNCVDINAPGVNITSAWMGSNSATNTISGTSMATPHVVGAAALYLQANPSATPAQVAAALTSNATTGTITLLPANTPNLLLYTGFLTSSAPVARFTQTCTALSCAFDASTSTALAAATYGWNFGDNSTGTGKTVNHTYAAGGTYSVTLTVTDANGSNSVTKQVVVTNVTNQPPVARFSSSCPTTRCAFDGSTSSDDVGIVKYTWDWGNGRSESHSGPTATNTFTAGTYNVTLTVTDGGGLTGSITKSVVVPTPTGNQSPSATISAPTTGTSVSQGSTVSFSGSANDPEDGALTGASLVWTSSRDGQIGTGTSFSTSTLSVGTHTITLTSTDSQGAHGTATITLTVTPVATNQPPTAAFTFTCVGQASPRQCAFDATGSSDDVGIVSYTWDWGNGKTEKRVGPIAKNTWAAAGTYTVTLTVRDGAGLAGSISKSVVIP